MMIKKAQDKELQWDQIPESDRPELYEAMGKEWKTWLELKAVRFCTPEESRQIPRYLTLGLGWRHKDKNASARSPQNPLPLKAKSRLTAQGQMERTAMNGEVRVGAPTAQRMSLLVFLQIVINLDWCENLTITDAVGAYLQGLTRAQHGKPKLFLRLPKEGIPGLQPDQLLEVAKSVYGLPDAARSWFLAFVEFVVGLGFRQHRLDPCWLLYWNSDGSTVAMILLHVDDRCNAGDGSPKHHELMEAIETRFPSGSKKRVLDGVATYTGRDIRMVRQDDELEIRVGMPNFEWSHRAGTDRHPRSPTQRGGGRSRAQRVQELRGGLSLA